MSSWSSEARIWDIAVFFSGILGHVLVRENFSTTGGSPPATPQLIEGPGEVLFCEAHCCFPGIPTYKACTLLGSGASLPKGTIWEQRVALTTTALSAWPSTFSPCY